MHQKRLRPSNQNWRSPSFSRFAQPLFCQFNQHEPHAVTPIRAKKKSTYTYPVSYSWGTGSVTLDTSTITTTGNVTLTGTSTPLYGTGTASTVTATLPHTTIKSHLSTTSTGATLVHMYIYTKSPYAPNGDSGTFVFNSSGDLVSGSASTLSRLRHEAYDADPSLVTAGYNNFGTVKKFGWAQCATGLAGFAAWISGFIDPAMIGVTIGLTAYINNFGVWTLQCF